MSFIELEVYTDGDTTETPVTVSINPNYIISIIKTSGGRATIYMPDDNVLYAVKSYDEVMKIITKSEFKFNGKPTYISGGNKC